MEGDLEDSEISHCHELWRMYLSEFAMEKTLHAFSEPGTGLP